MLLAKDFQDIAEWARSEGLTFDMNKTELLYFSRHRSSGNPTVQLQLPAGEHTVKPTAAGMAIRWLRIWFDRKLTFKTHVALAAKAKRTSAGIRALGNTVRGAPPHLLRPSLRAIGLCYGAEAWWPSTAGYKKANKFQMEWTV